jgi:hypothetical protein
MPLWCLWTVLPPSPPLLGPCPGFNVLGRDLLLTVAVKAEDTFLQSIQSHEADMLKHVQTGVALQDQTLPLGLARQGDRAGTESWLPEPVPSPNHQHGLSRDSLPVLCPR